MSDYGCHPDRFDLAQRRILWTALTLNAAMFVNEDFKEAIEILREEHKAAEAAKPAVAE